MIPLLFSRPGARLLVRANSHHDPGTGRFTSGGAGGSPAARKTQGFDWHHGQRAGLFTLPDIPVTQLRGDEFGADRASIRAGAMARLNDLRRSREPLVNKDTGWALAVSREDWSKITKQDARTTPELQAVAGLRQLVDRAVLAESHHDSKHANPDIQGIHRLYAPVEIGEKPYRVKLTVRDYTGQKSGDRTNLHALEAVEIESPGDAIALTSSPLGEETKSGTSTGRTLSVSDLLQGSKREDGSQWEHLAPLRKAIPLLFVHGGDLP